MPDKLGISIKKSTQCNSIDGETICESGNAQHKAHHVVNVFVSENQLILGELTVEEKTNEIIAVPELLDLIDVKSDIVTQMQSVVKKRL